MTKDETMSVADYISELHTHLSEAVEEVFTLETLLGEAREECTRVNTEREIAVNRMEDHRDFSVHTDAMIAELRNECATLEAENVRLVERVDELEKEVSHWKFEAKDWANIAGSQ